MKAKTKNMKKRSVVLLTVILILTLFIGVFSALPFSSGVYDYNPPLSKIKLGLDLKGGIYAVFKADKVKIDEDGEPVKDDDGNEILLSDKEFGDALNATVKSLENRLMRKGYSEATVRKEGSDSIRVEIPDVEDAEAAFAVIGKPAVLQFRAPNESDEREKGELLIKGSHVKTAQPRVNNEGQYVVYLEFDAEGKTAFADATSKYSSIYIWLDDSVISAPTVSDPITDGKATITGDFTAESVQNLALQIQSGALPLTLTTTLTRSVSPTLGENAITTSLIAAAAGLLVLLIFMFVMYKGLGVASNLSLLIYTVLYVLLLSSLPWVQLTLPGIAGVILSIGMAADGNIIIFERIKEEYKGGKSILTSAETGFKKSISAIVDGNVTTILGAVALWIFGSATLKGFAITLFVGIILSMICSLVFTNFFVKRLMKINATSAKRYNLKREGGYDGEI